MEKVAKGEEPLMPTGSRGHPWGEVAKHHSGGQKEKLIWGFGVGISRAKDELQVHCKRKFKPRSAKKMVPWLLWVPSPRMKVTK